MTGISIPVFVMAPLLILFFAVQLRWLRHVVAGVALFSGSLYVLAISGVPAWGAITPVGGVLFVFAWILLGTGVWRARRTEDYYIL